MRLRFWRMLTQLSSRDDIECPTSGEPSPGAVKFGVMPRYLRGAYVRASSLRSQGRSGEAEVYEEAINDLMQEHFRAQLRAQKRRDEAPIAHFQLGKDWSVYAVSSR